MYAVLQDIERIVPLMLEAHKESTMSKHTVDVNKLELHLNHWILNPKALVLVNESVTACYILGLSPSWWSEKECITDIFFYSQSPGAGIRLMKESKKWVDGFKNSITSVKITTSNSKPEVDEMYKKMGYKQTGCTFEEVI